MGTVTVVSGLE